MGKSIKKIWNAFTTVLVTLVVIGALLLLLVFLPDLFKKEEPKEKPAKSKGGKFLKK